MITAVFWLQGASGAIALVGGLVAWGLAAIPLGIVGLWIAWGLRARRSGAWRAAVAYANVAAGAAAATAVGLAVGAVAPGGVRYSLLGVPLGPVSAAGGLGLSLGSAALCAWVLWALLRPGIRALLVPPAVVLPTAG